MHPSITLKSILEKIAHHREEESTFSEDLSHFLDDFVPNFLLKDEILQKTFEVTEVEMGELYKIAYIHYQEKNYLLSLEHYRFLVILNPYERRYWMGYAASLQLLEELEQALHGYAIAALLDEEDPICHYHAYECYLKLKNSEEAKKALSYAYALCGDKSAHKRLKDFIKNIEDKLVVH